MMSTDPARSPFSRRNFLRGAVATGALAAAAPALAACGSSGSGSDSKGQISLMNRWSDPVSQKAAAALFTGFTTASGTKIINQPQPSSGSTYQPAVRTAFSSSNPPSMATDIAGPEVYNLARAGTLMDLTSFYNSTIAPRALTGATAGCTLNGKVYALCADTQVGNLVWYNAEILSKAGINPASLTTYSAWVAALAELQKGGTQPLLIGGKDQWPGGHYLNDLVQRALGSQQTAALYDRSVTPHAASAPKWTDPAVVDALADYVKLKPYFQNGFLGEASATTDSQFLAGKAAFYELGSWFLNTIQAAPPSFEVGVMLFPALEGGAGHGSEVTLTSTSLMASKNADRTAVQSFLSYLTEPKVAGAWAGDTASFMPYKVDAASVKVDPSIDSLWKKINGFLNSAGPDGSALYNDEAIDVNVYTRYIWQGSVGLMSGAVTPASLAQQLEDATVAASKALGS